MKMKHITDVIKIVMENRLVLLLFSLQLHLAYCSNVPKLILISMDGFRYDYLDRIEGKKPENFQYFVENGVKAKYIESVFPTVTYPNHFSLITGLYPESHGIVHNRFYDPELQTYFLYDDIRDNIDPLWYDVGAEPIYVTNHKAGNNRRSGSVVWPAGIGRVKCIGPDKLIPNANAWANISLTERVDTLISWFNSTKDPINLGLLYIPEPDEIAHEYGPDSQEVKDYITKDLNDMLGYLFKQLKRYELFDSTNIILTADHGFTSVTKYIALDDYINASWYTTGAKGDTFNNENHITMQIFPKPGEEERIFQALQKVIDIYVYRKGGVELQDLHYSNNERIAPIVITGQEGVVILKNMTQKDLYKLKGMHGFRPDIPNMRPFFLAMGPAFKKGFVADPFQNVDVYPLMCHILGITPAPNNGSLERVQQLLEDQPKKEMTMFTITAVSFVIIVGVTVTVAGIFAICACLNARKMPRLLFTAGSSHTGNGGNRSSTHHLLESEDDDEF